ncbi:hypothetical protein NCCP133_08650 [Cytobacillus sp. NCCP-133]|nr:hypothetical protein NCCP133_08650 [Cytobacillus sp. NCCP-133]
MNLAMWYFFNVPIDIGNRKFDRAGNFTMAGIIIVPYIKQDCSFVGTALVQAIAWYIFHWVISFEQRDYK